MLQSVHNLFGYTIAAADGNVGKVDDMLFDDRGWSIRYVVADTGKWLPGRKVLLAPESLGQPLYDGKLLPAQLTKKRIEDSPPLASDAPVSKRHESDLMQYYAWGAYPGLNPAMVESIETDDHGDPHLRSAREVIGYHIAARDGNIGHVEDFVVEEENWVLRYVVVDTRNWLPGKKVLVSTAWAHSVDWAGHQIALDLERDRIEDAPPYNPADPVNREYEERLYDYYGRPVYWGRDAVRN